MRRQRRDWLGDGATYWSTGGERARVSAMGEHASLPDRDVVPCLNPLDAPEFLPKGSTGWRCPNMALTVPRP